MTSLKTLQAKERAFTLVETMVAISILMLAVLGPLSIASSGLRTSMHARDQITAYYLAQEGIEYARYVRDMNYIQLNSDWMANLETCFTTNGCILDPYEAFQGGDTAVSACGSSCTTASRLYFTDGTKGYYSHVSTGRQISPFSRVMKLSYVDGSDGNEVNVRVAVKWKTSSLAEKEVELQENLFNIYNNAR